jgi:hypothetical protein
MENGTMASEVAKTFALLICDKKDFLRKKGKVIQTKALTHEQGIGYFLENYGPELIGLTIISFCFEDNQKDYGYRYSMVE